MYLTTNSSTDNATFANAHQSHPIQRKMTLGQPDDQYEREADTVADQVVSMPEATIQRKCSSCEEEGDIVQTKRISDGITPLVQRSGGEGSGAVSSEVSAGISGSKGAGAPIASGVKESMENRFGADFGDVKIHTDSKAQELNSQLHAKAFTVGNDIYFNKGEYQPESKSGQHLLAHELTHTLQQKTSDHIMRACDCTKAGGRKATAQEFAYLNTPTRFPNLVQDEFCITGQEDPSYNCHAYATGNTSEFFSASTIDQRFGDKDGNPTMADFDAYYMSQAGLVGSDAGDSNAKVILYKNGNKIKHSAVARPGSACGSMAESKLGSKWRILHDPFQIEGGIYGKAFRYYS